MKCVSRVNLVILNTSNYTDIIYIFDDLLIKKTLNVGTKQTEFFSNKLTLMLGCAKLIANYAQTLEIP